MGVYSVSLALAGHEPDLAGHEPDEEQKNVRITPVI